MMVRKVATRTLAVMAWLVIVAMLTITMVIAAPTSSSSNRLIPLDLSELEEMGIDPQDLIHHLKQFAQGNIVCGAAPGAYMRRHFLRNTTVTCNDGSPAGYYIKPSTSGSKRWIIFLEGGWFCFDEMTCQSRWVNKPNLMSSSHWPDRKKGDGILSWSPDENPFLHDANIVQVPYCSSDSWSGTRAARAGSPFSFMGSLILEEVVNDLLLDHGLSAATRLYLAGSSAGGTGVLLNLDRVATLLSLRAPRVEVRGIADSGWFLDNKQYRDSPCLDTQTCAPTEGVLRGIVLWQGRVPDTCKAAYPVTEHWKCYFGYRVYPHIKAPVFVVQNLFDEAQITADNVGPPIRKEQWQYIHNLGQDIKQTVNNVSAVFAPACLSHDLLSRSGWHRVSIEGVTLPEALRCWEDGRQERNIYSKTNDRTATPYSLLTGKRQPMKDDARPHGPRRKQDKRKRKKKKHRRKKKDKKPKKDRPRISEEKRRRRQERKRRRRNELEMVSRSELRQDYYHASNMRPEYLDIGHQRPHDSPPQTSDSWGGGGDGGAYTPLTRGSAVPSTDFTSLDRGRAQPTDPTGGGPVAGGGIRQRSHRSQRHRHRRSAILFDVHDLHHMQYHENQCSHHKVDHCAWPQCNFSCPKIHNPYTGEEVDFIDLLMQFGLDMSSIAEALGMDLPTLQAMDHDILLRKLVQHSR